MIKKLKYLKYYARVLLNNWTVKKDSYAQHSEDKLVESLLPNGVTSFIDIGANDGVLFSNTYKFAKLRARGLCIEPSRNSFLKLRLNHLFHPNIRCIQAAVSDFNGQIFLNEDGYESTLSYVNKTKNSNSYSVKCHTLDEVLAKYPKFREVDLLSVDVEGHERPVFEGLSENNLNTKIMIIEADKSGIHELLTLTSLNDYEPIFTNGINTILKNKRESFSSLAKPPKGFSPC